MKLVLFDIDGTLLNYGKNINKLTKKTKEALNYLKAHGYYVFIATGRPYCFISEDLWSFGFDGFILSDGAYTLFREKELAYHPIREADIQSLIAQMPNRVVLAYTKRKAYYFNGDGFLLDYCRSFGFNDDCLSYVNDIDDIKEEITKLHIRSLTKKDYDSLIVDENKFFSFDDSRHLLKEIYPNYYTKATALQEVIDELHINQEETYFFGDGPNDIEMMDAVNHAICIETAFNKVKRHADYICSSIEKDGIGEFIFHSGLFK